MTQEKEIRFRDSNATQYDEWYAEKGQIYLDIETEVIMNHLNVAQHETIFDAGCGTGKYSIRISTQAKEVYGMDFSSKSLEVLEQKYSLNDILNIRMFKGSLEDKRNDFTKLFDKILCVQVLQHIQEEECLIEILKNFNSYLKDGGTLLITVYNWNIKAKLRKYLSTGYFGNGSIFYRRFKAVEIEKILEKAGFRNIETSGLLNFLGYRQVRQTSFLYRFLFQLDRFLSRFKISIHFGDFLIVTAGN